jgi:RimJ/RimL family protein N-acetyltransferase
MSGSQPSGAPLRLTLREFETRDRDAVIAMHRDTRVREWLVDDVPLDDARWAAEFIERMRGYYRAHPGLGIWCAERWRAALSAEELADPEVRDALSDEALEALATPSPQFIGWFNLMRVTDLPDEIEIGCRLVPEVWGSGIVHDGGERLLDQAFGDLNVPRVWGICHPAHRSVHHVLRTLGFRDDGQRPSAGTMATWFVIDRATWIDVREVPRRERLRASLSIGA